MAFKRWFRRGGKAGRPYRFFSYVRLDKNSYIQWSKFHYSVGAGFS